MESETSGEPAYNERTVKAKNFFARLGGVFFSPHEAFTEIGRAQRLVISIIAAFLISAFGGLYIAQKVDMRAASREQMEFY